MIGFSPNPAIRCRLASFVSLAALALAPASPLRAQDGQAEEDGSGSLLREAGQASGDPDTTTIVVIGERAIIVTLADVPVERAYDEEAIAAYAASSVGEVLDRLREENGDSDPALLVNGRPLSDRNDIADLPAEAIARIETLPRGSAQRVGGLPGQRVYNVVLKNRVRTATVTGEAETATEGGWSNLRGEVQLTSIKGQNRLNLTLRGARSTTLLESERDFVPRVETVPFSAAGNVLPAFAGEVDPSLSALAGFPVTVVALPPGDSGPTLAELVAGANRINPSEQSRFRTLRGPSRPLEIALSGNRELTPAMSLSFNARLGWLSSSNLSGLPNGRFLLLPDNEFSPFAVPVYIALNDPARPLTSSFESATQSLSATLNALLGEWRASLSARYDRRAQSFAFQFTGPLFGGDAIVDAAENPFSGTLAGRIPIVSRESHSRTSTVRMEAEAQGPLLSLWSGPLSARFSADAGWIDYSARSSFDERDFNRRELGFRAGLTLPLTGAEPAFLPWLGESDLSADIGWADLGRYGSLERRALVLGWQPVAWLRMSATAAREGRPLSPELQSAPAVITPNVPYFDPLNGDSVEVTAIYGGAGALTSEELRTRSVTVTATPWPKYALQLDAEYVADDLRDQIGALPPPSTAIVLAFPERFQRDSNGTLVLVDNRSVNFARQRSHRVRFGFRATIPFGGSLAPVAPAPGKPLVRIQPVKLQVNASHSIFLENRLTIREGLPEVDLLDGGAIGIAGGQQRTMSNAGLSLTKGASGVRLDLRRRGRNALIYGTLADPERLRFGALTTIDARAFVDLQQVFAQAPLAKRARVTLGVDNLLNERQRVTDEDGTTPQPFQPVRRDPLGRVVSIELRKVF